jgi:hypothetical protein
VLAVLISQLGDFELAEDATFPEVIQTILQAIQETIKTAAPDAEEKSVINCIIPCWESDWLGGLLPQS